MPGLTIPYATLDQLRARFAVAGADTSDDARLLAKLKSASQQIDRFTARTFAPVYATRLFDWDNARSILLRGFDLLQLITLTNGDGNVIDPTAIIPLGGVNGPVYCLEINIAKGAFLNYLTVKTRALSVYGIWGWHDDWLGSAWKPSGDSVTTFGLSSGGTALTVSNAAGADSWGLSPRFQTGQLIQIDSEYMLTTAVNAGTNTLTVIRGVNGTSGATHTIGAPISIYAPPADIVEITLRYAAWLTKLEDAGEWQAATMTADGSAGGVHVAAQLPADLQIALQPFRKLAGGV